MAVLGAFQLPTLVNEPFISYEPKSPERTKLQIALQELEQREAADVWPNVDGKDVHSGETVQQISPFNHKLVLANYRLADEALVEKAIDQALAAKESWIALPFHDRAAIFYRAASLLQNKYKYEMMAATMLGQGKNPYQADIDCIAESIDFLKTFPALAEQLYKTQPPFNTPGVWNRSEVRPLDGFVYAVSPFNFTALAVNLVLAPIIVGNVVIWKPSDGAILSSWLFNKIMIEAGLPAGVLQFVPGNPQRVTDAVLSNRQFSALHFTGSTQVFRELWTKIGAKIDFWASYPRLVGETSGKNFHLIHSSAMVRNAALKTIRAAFEYQGQKCSACSRVYVPKSLSEEFLAIMVKETRQLSMGSKITDFCGPVINRSAFQRISKYIEDAKSDTDIEILEGGQCDDSTGFYIRPTILKTKNADSQLMKAEIFGPVVAVYVYDDATYGPELFKIIDETSTYALSGAVFANERTAVTAATEALRFAAGNFYVNDQCTGAMPGHQPFGGSRGSGTNDKAGSATLLQRFISSRTIKENFGVIDEVLYPSNIE
ncbi:1-pyrroline-5-carboxylate dehydrogenase [Pyrenochaeta sp. DS3sAY3a]|nr:1-pyrroline-5-carboxylate dehydrogenase [Pyrenochaeta sp. DS3sAY3a]